MDPSVAIFGPLDTYLAPYIAYVMLVLVLANIATRAIEHRRIVRQARDGGAEAISRHPIQIASDLVLLLAAFYYMTVELHAGLIVTTVVVGLFLTDVFEFESRLVEARQDWEIERPKAAIGASLLALAYVSYQALFFVVRPLWESIV